MGVLLVTPLVLTFPALLRIRNRDRLMELVALLVLLTTACVFVFGDLPQIKDDVHVLAIIVLPFVMWAAIRFGVSGAALSIVIVATIATVETALGSGPFAINGPFTNAVLLDVFFGVLSITGLALAAVCAEREQAHRERETMVAKQAAIEAFLQNQKVLQESEQRLRVATQAGRMYAYEWDVATDAVARAGAVEAVLAPEEASGDTRRQWLERVHPEDRARLAASVSERTPESPDSQVSYRILRPDGSILWLERTAHGLFDEQGKMTRMIGIVVDITQRKLAEEERFRHAAIVESSSDAIISENCDGIITSWNAGAQHMFGYSEAEAVGKPMSILIPPELVPEENKVLERLRAGDRIEHYETVRLTESGKPVDVSVTVSPIKDSIGKIVGFSKIARDITERRLAEQAMAEMSRRLVAVQEEERTRIARDLHDDINQRLALLAIETDTLRDNLPNGGDEMGRRLTHIRDGIVDVSSGVQSISHQLHSSQLEYLGIDAAMKIFCREYSARQSVEIDFASDEIPKVASPEISLGLFRIMQEALSNAAKHSRVRHFEVKLGCSADQLHLKVSDSGSGFDANIAKNKGGMGLFSMRERARLMNGTIAIESKLLGGTTINVHVPLKAEQSCAQVAG
jgi:PAS domain S-box-containing protein